MSSLSSILLVGLGGFLGSVLRYLLGGLAQRLAPGATIPPGTLAVNVLGCLVIGFVATWAEGRGHLGEGGRLFVVVGLLGGFTTFSAFGLETLTLLERQGWAAAGLNIGSQLLAGLGAVILGAGLARLL